MKNWINNLSEQRLCFRLIFGEIKRKDGENIIFHLDRFECGGGNKGQTLIKWFSRFTLESINPRGQKTMEEKRAD